MYDASDDAGSSRTDQPSAPTGPNLLPIPNMPGGYYDPATGDLYSNGQKVGGHYDAGSNTLTDPNGKTCWNPRRSDRRSEEHTSELQSPYDLVCRLLLEKKKKHKKKKKQI